MEGNITPQPSSPAAAHNELPDFTSLPLWQRRLLAAIQGGATNDEAIRNCGSAISRTTVLSELNKGGDFSRALALISAGVAVIGIETARDIVTAEITDLVERLASEAKDGGNSLGHRVAAARWLTDVRGYTGQPTQVNISNVTNQAASIVQELRKRPKRTVEGEQVSPPLVQEA